MICIINNQHCKPCGQLDTITTSRFKNLFNQLELKPTCKTCQGTLENTSTSQGYLEYRGHSWMFQDLGHIYMTIMLFMPTYGLSLKSLSLG